MSSGSDAPEQLRKLADTIQDVMLDVCRSAA